MKKEEFYFDSQDKVTKIHGIKWIPDTEEPRCIVQLVHGMAEYIERYDEFARFLTEKNILVVGHDHLGHGGSIGGQGMKGYFCKENAPEVLVEDVNQVRVIMQEKYPKLPYVILGHSMGSFIVRNYLFKYSEGLSGAVIMGTGYKPAALLKVSKAVTTLQRCFLGDRHVSNLIDRMAFGSYHKRIENYKTKQDWLSKDEVRVNAYIADEYCGFVFTVNGFRTLFELIDRACRLSNMKKMNKALPVLFVAGEDDPVGDYGKGVKKVYEMFKQAGMQKLSIKLYPSDRHEILNETDRETVSGDILSFLDRI